MFPNSEKNKTICIMQVLPANKPNIRKDKEPRRSSTYADPLRGHNPCMGDDLIRYTREKISPIRNRMNGVNWVHFTTVRCLNAYGEYFQTQPSRMILMFLFVPYIKTDVLERSVGRSIPNRMVIVTTWEPQRTFKTGSSELSLFSFCQRRGIALYVSQRTSPEGILCRPDKRDTSHGKRVAPGTFT